MSEQYLVLAARIRQELEALEKVATRAKRALTLARKYPADEELYLDAVALNLHDFYTGLERVFHHIAATLDETVPQSRDWHQELLRQMAEERPPIRPAVISEETRESLDEYLRFRHVVRNIYAFEFDSERLGRLVQGLDFVFPRINRELQAFAQFLERLVG